jgi:hypothetical protein
MLMLFSNITNLFSNDEKQRFTTIQESVSKMKLLIKYLMNVVMEIEKKEKRFTNGNQNIK